MRWVARVPGLLVCVLVFLPLAAAAPATGPSAGGARPDRAEPPTTNADDPQLTRLVAAMTLEEKIGQLFVAYAYGDSADSPGPADVAANQAAYGVDSAAELVERYHLGGVVYFDWANNSSSNDPRRIAALSNDLQRAAVEQRHGIPLVIAIDQEGGPVTRIGEPVTQFPDAMTIGATGQASHARSAAEVTGRELRAMGINVNYAPVADVNVNPANPIIGPRAFSADPDVAAEMTAAQVHGYQSEGVAATAKHFPGHGDTDVDSHTGVPVITHTREEWERLDAPPFAAAIDAEVDAIMAGHLVFPDLDPSGDPATLSEPIITGLLREHLGYDGVVVTDALDMAGVREHYGDERVPVLALQAGVDQLLQSPNGRFDLQYNAVLDAVADGELSEERIDASVLRILRLKERLDLFSDPYADEARVDTVVGAAEHRQVAERITAASGEEQ